MEELNPHKKLVLMVNTVLDAVEHVPEHCPPDFVVTFEAVCRAALGLRGLASKSPGSASLSDARYIMQTAGWQTGICADLPKIGRTLLSALRKAPYWPDAFAEFQECIGPLEMAKDDYQRCLADARNCLDGVTLASATSDEEVIDESEHVVSTLKSFE